MNRVWQQSNMKYTKKENFIYDLLKKRGVSDPDEFLRITKKKFHNPYLMKDMKKAVTRIVSAIRNKEKIGIFGDYDADGVSSTSLWVLILEELGADVTYFIPDRFVDGYGVNKRGIDKLKDDHVSLLITCDTGITAISEVAYAKSIGLDVLITDHHEPQRIESFDSSKQKQGRSIDDYLIPHTIVINPKRPDCKYPFKELAGVGVTFKILCALCEKLHPAKRAGAYQFIDIVSLGTFADMMQIIDENRVIGSLGLQMINHTKNRGLYQLLRANDLGSKSISSQDIGWTIAPCINAAGRIVSAEQAVEMLISNNRLDAYRYAKELVRINSERKELTKNYVNNIIRTVEADQEENPTSIIIHYHPEVPEGIVGLISARMMNHFYKPVILLTDAEEKGLYKGSGRSIPSFDIFHALMQYTSLMEGFGGHAGACGLSVTEDNFEELKSMLEMFADTMLSSKDLQPVIYIDCIVKGDIVDLDFAHEILKLEPFGRGNQKPSFMMEKMKIIKCKAVGEEKNHFWALLSDGKKTFSAIGFFLWGKYEAIGEPKYIDVAFFPDVNEYQGKTNVQLKLDDLRKAK